MEYLKKIYEDFIETKLCNKCGLEKHIDEFYKNRGKCKSCMSIDNKKYKLNNRDKILLLKKRYHNSEKGKETDRKYYLEYRKNMPDYVKDKLKASHTKYCRDRYKSDSLYKLMVSMRNLIGLSFRKKKSVKNKKTEEIIGCSIEEFKNFIENKFTDGMSWDNQGIWHLDHIIPISRAKDEDDLIKLNHYTNFKPMWGIENIKKGNRYDG